MRVDEENFVQAARMYDFEGMKMTDSCIQGLRLYLYHKVPTGSFLHSVLTNDLKGAVARADNDNIHNIPAYVGFLYAYFPFSIWGSEEAVDNWLSQ